MEAYIAERLNAEPGKEAESLERARNASANAAAQVSGHIDDASAAGADSLHDLYQIPPEMQTESAVNDPSREKYGLTASALGFGSGIQEIRLPEAFRVANEKRTHAARAQHEIDRNTRVSHKHCPR